MNRLYNPTVIKIIQKLGHDCPRHDWFWCKDGWLWGQSNSSHIKGYFGTPHKILPVSDQEAADFLALSNLEREADNHKAAAAAERARKETDVLAKRPDLPANIAGVVVNKHLDVEDEWGNFLFALPKHLAIAPLATIENQILARLEDLESIGD